MDALCCSVLQFVPVCESERHVTHMDAPCEMCARLGGVKTPFSLGVGASTWSGGIKTPFSLGRVPSHVTHMDASCKMWATRCWYLRVAHIYSYHCGGVAWGGVVWLEAVWCDVTRVTSHRHSDMNRGILQCMNSAKGTPRHGCFPIAVVAAWCSTLQCFAVFCSVWVQLRALQDASHSYSCNA